MGKIRSGQQKKRMMAKESGSTSRVVNPSSSISECFIDVGLPQELITEILVRLPVKSLLRFKCVSKSWLYLISDPHFIRSHLSKSSSMEVDELNLQLLCDTAAGMKKCCLYSALHETDPLMHISAFAFTAQNKHSVVGIINGLVCLNLEGKDLCVWNPALNKIKYFNVCPKPASGRLGCSYSFGYEESHDDYKVVCLQTVAEGNGNDIEVRIYSLKAESWRRIYQLKGLYLPDHGVFAYGKIYWCNHLFANPNRKILSLDMSSEKFVELQTPQYDNDGINCVSRMGESGGQPFMFCNYFVEKKVDLWVLDKCGVEESWCKLVSFPYTDVNSRISIFYSQVLCIFSNRDIVIGHANGLQPLEVYNYKKKESRGIQTAVGITTSWEVAAAYVETMVWPDYA